MKLAVARGKNLVVRHGSKPPNPPCRFRARCRSSVAVAVGPDDAHDDDDDARPGPVLDRRARLVRRTGASAARM